MRLTREQERRMTHVRRSLYNDKNKINM